MDELKQDITKLSTQKAELQQELAAITKEKTTSNAELSDLKLELSGIYAVMTL